VYAFLRVVCEWIWLFVCVVRVIYVRFVCVLTLLCVFDVYGVCVNMCV